MRLSALLLLQYLTSIKKNRIFKLIAGEKLAKAKALSICKDIKAFKKAFTKQDNMKKKSWLIRIGSLPPSTVKLIICVSNLDIFTIQRGICVSSAPEVFLCHVYKHNTNLRQVYINIQKNVSSACVSIYNEEMKLLGNY